MEVDKSVTLHRKRYKSDRFTIMVNHNLLRSMPGKEFRDHKSTTGGVEVADRLLLICQGLRNSSGSNEALSKYRRLNLLTCRRVMHT